MSQTRPPKMCGLYMPGHRPIGFSSTSQTMTQTTDRSRRCLTDVSDNGVLIVEFDDQQVQLWNHDPGR